VPARRRGGEARKPRAVEDPLARAKAIALRQVALRARTEAQLRARLARDDLSAQADEVIGWLRGLGYLDDAAYARARARALLAPGQLGPRKVEERLLRAGLSPAEARGAIREALAAEGDEPRVRERQLCRVLAERRARAPLDALDDPARARLSRFLAGRGFSGSVVSAVLGIHVDVES
jgi:regulatory protein